MMTISSRVVLTLAGLALVLASCSDDDTPTDGGGTVDTTPPGVASITAVDANHVNVAFDEDVNRDSAQRSDNYTIVEGSPPPLVAGPATGAPGDTTHVISAALGSDGRTVTLTTAESMVNTPYDMTIVNVADLSGNRITTPVTTSFDGTSATDMTPPTVVFRSPAPNATGVGVAEPVSIWFSEPVSYGTVQSGLSWTSTSGSVPFSLGTEDQVRYAVTAMTALATGTTYTVSLSGVQDFAGNTMAPLSWSFTTTSTPDTQPPTLVSSVPAHLATGVSLNTNLSLTFSEPVNQTSFEVLVTPDVGAGIETWSNGGRTVTFDPNDPLQSNQAYTLTILPGGVKDLAGNGIANAVNIQFTTGSSFPSGSIAGTISGDPTSADAADPTGGVVIAADRNPFGLDDFGVAGSAIVAGNDSYEIANLPDDVYYLIGAMDSNGDSSIDPDFGDAIGAYGANIVMGDFDPDSVIVSGGAHVTGIDFPLFDGSAITGTISYSGIYSGGSYPLYIGAFDTTGFDPTGPPDYGTGDFYPLSNPWRLNELDGELADGTFYVGAFLDINFNGNYDPLSEPAGVYGGATPTPLTVADGKDFLGLTITLNDVAVPMEGPAVSWRVNRQDRPEWLRRLADAIRDSRNGLPR